jgi:hypothetical protein
MAEEIPAGKNPRTNKVFSKVLCQTDIMPELLSLFLCKMLISLACLEESRLRLSDLFAGESTVQKGSTMLQVHGHLNA